jgi:hypothetical protein
MNNEGKHRRRRARWLTGAALGGLLATSAAAQTTREAELERRIAQLEAVVQRLQTAAEAASAEQAAATAAAQSAASAAEAAATRTAAVETRVAAVEARPQAPAEGMRVGNSTVRLGGFVRTVAAFSRFDDGVLAGNSLGRDFYLPQQIPVGGTSEGIENDFSAKQTRLWMTIATDVAGHRLGGYVEADFQTAVGTQGSERTTNGYNLALRRAYVTVDNVTIGQDWTTFQYVGALPETTDFVGPTEGTVFVREPLIRYSPVIGTGTTLHLAVENPETASATLGSAALVENDDDRLPDVIARVQHNGDFGEVSFAGAVRQLTVINGAADDNAMGWGLSAAGKIFLNDARSADFRFMATYGQGMGRYIGLNFAPDAIWVPGTASLRPVENMAAFAALRVPLGGTVRSTVMGSWQRASYPDGFAAGTFNAYNRQAWSLAGNLFFTPVRGLDLGVEYRHGTRELVSGVSGQLDRLEFAAKFSF